MTEDLKLDLVDIPKGTTEFLTIPEPFRSRPSKYFGTEQMEYQHGMRRYVMSKSIRMMSRMVTRRQYRSLMDVNNFSWVDEMELEYHRFSIDPEDDGDYPASAVSWVDAVEFARRASSVTGCRLRLPSELEWEYAAKAGGVAPFFWLNDRSDVSSLSPEEVLDEDVARRYAWFSASGYRDEGERLRKVGELLPNQFGLFDMIGLLGEWVGDGYEFCADRPWIRRIEMPAVATDWVFGYGEDRVVKGGGFQFGLSSNSPVARLARNEDSEDVIHGFRLVMDVP